MSGNAALDVSRLIRIASVLSAIATATLGYCFYEPRVESLRYHIADTEAALRSVEVAQSEMPQLREERDALAMRYAHFVTQNSEAVFLHDVANIVRVRRLRLLTTSMARASNAKTNRGASAYLETHVTLEMRGAYRNVLLAIGDLSTGSAIVAVEAPNLHRDGDAVVASVPVVIYEPPQITKAGI